MIKVTASQFAENFGIDYLTANNLLKYLHSKELVKVVGKEPARSMSGRGKPSTIYQVPAKVTLHFQE